MRKISIPAIVLGMALVCGASSFAANARLLETGSTLLYPLMNLWVAAYQKDHGDVQITTQGTGSGTGISQAISGVAQIGASDAYMSDSQMKMSEMLNIPLAISAQQINYNVQGLNDVHLNLSGSVLAGIYSGTIQYWDDAKIKAINAKYASKLPHNQIIPIHRADGSGDTFLFTQYLSFSDPGWKSGPGYGTTVSWPSVASAVGATGNPGMVQGCSSTPNSIAYIGISFLNQTNAAHLGYAALQNRDGKFVLPSEQTITSAAKNQENKVPADGRMSLIYGPGADSYPIINFEYAIVNPKQPDDDTKNALVDFLKWALSPSGGNDAKYLGAVHFLPLTPTVRQRSLEQVNKIS
jgi:phosphate transport system substrate-binding protein